MRVANAALLLIAAGLSLPAPSLVAAQTARGGNGGGQSAQAMAQLQQMAVERNALQSQVGRLKEELATAQAAASKSEAQLGALRVRAVAAESKVKQAASDQATAEHVGSGLQARLDDVMGRLRQAVDTIKTTEAERSALVDRLATLTRAQNTCVDNNAALYLVATEVIDRFESLGLGSALARSEPFTRLARIRAENAADAYRDRVTALREKATTGANRPSAEKN